MLKPKTCSILAKALREGLKHREVIETSLYDWEGNPQPNVVAQLTGARILAQPFAGSKTLAEIKQWLKKFGLELRPTLVGDGKPS